MYQSIVQIGYLYFEIFSYIVTLKNIFLYFIENLHNLLNC